MLRSADETDVRRHAFAATFRYGDGEVLAGVLGCGVADRTVRVPVGGRRGCVFLTETDLVTPPSLTNAWLADPGMRRARAAVSGHGKVDGAALEALAALPGSVDGCWDEARSRCGMLGA